MMENERKTGFKWPGRPALALLLLGLFLAGAAGFGVVGRVLQAAKLGVIVITLHEVDAEIDSPWAVGPADLKAMIVAAREAGYNFITLEQFHSFTAGGGSIPPRAVLLTFDDGYRGVYLNGYPVLAEYDCPAAMFPITKWFSSSPRPEEFSRSHLTMDDALEMLASGLWGFGGHTHDGHRLLPGGPEERLVHFTVGQGWLGRDERYETRKEYLARVATDIEAMSSELRRLGVEPQDFAAPGGRINTDLEQMLAEAGYRFIYVEGYELNYPGQRLVYRVNGGTTADDFLRALNSVDRWPWVRDLIGWKNR